MRTVTEKELDVFELELAIKWAHAATLMDKNPEVSYLFALSETALREKLERLNSAPPPNDPLTLEELREMNGEPVYLDLGDGGEWALVRLMDGKVHFTHKNTICAPANILFECGGKAYRRKPEEGTN